MLNWTNLILIIYIYISHGFFFSKVPLKRNSFDLTSCTEQAVLLNDIARVHLQNTIKPKIRIFVWTTEYQNLSFGSSSYCNKSWPMTYYNLYSLWDVLDNQIFSYQPYEWKLFKKLGNVYGIRMPKKFPLTEVKYFCDTDIIYPHHISFNILQVATLEPTLFKCWLQHTVLFI